MPRDPLAAYWVGQANARLRRELAWAWHERGILDPRGALPPFTDRASHAVDLVRRWDEKLGFYASDPAASYLTAKIEEPPPSPPESPPHGSFSWLVAELSLEPVECFWLGLALSSASDAAVGSVMAACANDSTRTRPTLALAQQLWDLPEEVVRLCDPMHRLHRLGIVVTLAPHLDWDATITVPALVAPKLFGSVHDAPASLVAITDPENPDGTNLDALAALLAAARPERLEVVAVTATRGDAQGTALALARRVGRTLLRVRDDVATTGRDHLDALATWAWLADVDLFLPESFVGDGRAQLPREGIPIRLYVDAGESPRRHPIPERLLAASLIVSPPDHTARAAAWTTTLGARAIGAEAAIAECARRFRYGRAAIRRIARATSTGTAPITFAELGAACRLELRQDFGDLAQALEPRFRAEELVLPPAAHTCFAEILRAMRALTEVHYTWGTARALSSAGVAVLFAGPSGTGKTMAAECLASALDLPLYRVDVSQVVDKYVGETEKNLRRIFDAAERGDCVLFLDEAESIFGRRMEARSAQDRWANLEISYLLTRMESAKGLTILATNRKDDFDSAFMRRLRYVLEFPMPDVDARMRIWRQCIPPGADASTLDIDLLARRFALSGGQIRSVVFNACLQCAGDGRRLTLEQVMVAIWRELAKQERSVGLAPFGAYADAIKKLVRIDG
ncbi:MAG TPA: ATP-binding protein [Kofleriaceae bacterium]